MEHCIARDTSLSAVWNIELPVNTLFNEKDFLCKFLTVLYYA